MANCDGSTEHGVPSGLRFYIGNALDWDRFRYFGPHFHLGDLGDARHVPRLAQRAGDVVRFGLEHFARQHHPHGLGILPAVRANGCYRGDSGKPR